MNNIIWYKATNETQRTRMPAVRILPKSIELNKAATELLGNPEFAEVGFDPDQRIMVIVKTTVSTGSLKVIKRQSACAICCTDLVRTISDTFGLKISSKGIKLECEESWTGSENVKEIVKGMQISIPTNKA